MAPGQRTGIATMDADLARCSANVSSWHETDMRLCWAMSCFGAKAEKLCSQ
jgi:hypothetical protein